MEPLKSMTINELQQIVNDTAFDYDIRIKADTEILRREKIWGTVGKPSWAERREKADGHSI